MQGMTFRLTSVSPMFFGAPVSEKKRNDETHDQYEERTWSHKVHKTPEGAAFIQPFALKNALESAGSRLNMKLTGKSTYTKLFRQGILVVDHLILHRRDGKPVMIAEEGEPATTGNIQPHPMFVPSDGKKGSGKRVWRIFPEVQFWTADAKVQVLDPRITQEIMLAHLKEAGKFIGFGSMRVENGGITGRFDVEAVK